MPDALSKTIPIWCSVLNRALFPDRIEYHELFTPPQAVSSSEHAQMAARLEEFLNSFLALGIDRTALRTQINKPLRPIWVTPDSHISPEGNIFKDYHPIICCTASRRVPGGEISEGGYIQGSGDDTENWAFGLTPPIFWANTQLLLSTPEPELPELIPKLVAASTSCPIDNASMLAPIPPTTSLHITDLKAASSLSPGQQRLIIYLYPDTTSLDENQILPHSLSVNLGPHKLGSRNLRTALPTIIDFISTGHIQTQSENNNPEPPISITIACSTGKDHSVGVALAILCLFYNDDGQLCGARDGHYPSIPRLRIDKTYIRQRLSWIMTTLPDANPSGATLQSVNSFLMRPPN